MLMLSAKQVSVLVLCISGSDCSPAKPFHLLPLLKFLYTSIGKGISHHPSSYRCVLISLQSVLLYFHRVRFGG